MIGKLEVGRGEAGVRSRERQWGERGTFRGPLNLRLPGVGGGQEDVRRRGGLGADSVAWAAGQTLVPSSSGARKGRFLASLATLRIGAPLFVPGNL